MTIVLGARAKEKRAAGEALIREADDLACQSWNEKMWSDGGPIDPSPTVDQAVNGGYPFLELRCSRCKGRPRSVDLTETNHVSTTCVHDIASRLICRKCKRIGNRSPAELLQLGRTKRYVDEGP